MIIVKIPYLITLSLFLIVALMTIGEVIGKESIVCFDHDYDQDLYPGEEKLEFSFFNPIKGKNWGCTVHGVMFLSVLTMYEFYTLLLSFVIFRQFYSPMRPLWSITQKWWHIMLWTIIFLIDLGALLMSSFSGIYPMGVCLPGPGRKWELLLWVNIPLTFCTVMSTILLLGSAWLLRKELIRQSEVVNKDSTGKIQDLLHRLTFYAVGVLGCLILIMVTGFQFFSKSDGLSNSMDESIECQLNQILLSDDSINCEAQRKESISAFFFISWVIAAILGVGSQLVLSCHNEARNRLKRAATIKNLGSTLQDFKEKTLGSGSKTRSGDHRITVPASPRSKSGSSPRFDNNNKGKKNKKDKRDRIVTITGTPQRGPVSVERVLSTEEDDTTIVYSSNGGGTYDVSTNGHGNGNIELITAKNGTAGISNFSLGDSRMLSLQSLDNDAVERSATPITPDDDGDKATNDKTGDQTP